MDGDSGKAEVTGIESVNVKLLKSATFAQTLMTGVTKVSVGTSSIDATNLTVTGGDLATTYEVASGKTNGLTVTYLDATGTADTAKLSLGGVGTSSAATGGDAAISVASGDKVEAVTIATTGTNYVDLSAGTAAKTITVTGSGNNYIDIISAATSVTVDGSDATGLFDLNMADTLSNGDVLKAGAGSTDKLTATVASTADNAPTVSGFETLALTLSAAVNLSLANVTGAKSITLADSAVTQRLSNVADTVTSISLQETSTSANNVRIDYVTGADATLALNFAPSATSVANVTYGTVTLSGVENLTLSATGAFKSTVGDVNPGSALTDLTVKTSAETGDFTIGTIAARNLENVTVNAAAGDVTITDIDNDAYATVKSFVINATGGADVTVANGADLEFYEAATGADSALNEIKIIGGAESVIKVGTITGAAASTDVGDDVAITVEFGEDSGGSDIGAIDVVGVASLDITVAENAGIASEVGLVTAQAENVGDINVTVNDDAILEFDGVTAGEGDIGDVTITTVGDGKVSDIAGNDVDITATKGDIGNVKVTSGNGGTVELQITAAAGSVGTVTVTSNADDEVYIKAEDDIRNVTMTVAKDDTLTTVLDASTIGNISITGSGDGSVTIQSTDAQGAARATTGNITISLAETAGVASTVDISDVTSAGTTSITTGAGDDTIRASKAEVFTVTLAGTVATGQTLTFDGVTVTVGATQTVDAVIGLLAAATYENWTVTASSTASDTVTFTAKNPGAVTDVAATAFTGTTKTSGTLTTTPAVDTDGGNIATAVSLSGGAGADNIFGGSDADTLTGGDGADTIYGGSGADTINSGADNDVIYGGSGADVINVGSGTDTVVFNRAGDTQTGVVATGFTFSGDRVSGMGNSDKIDLSKLANLVVSDGAISVGTTFHDGTADTVKLVSGSFDATTGVFTAGAASTTNNDYLLQYAGGTTTTTVNSVMFIDVVGTLTVASSSEVLTFTIA